MKTPLTCILIDDEEKCRSSLRSLLENYCPMVSIIGEADDRRSIFETLKNHTPDLVFIDIEIGSTTAFDILNELEEINFKIVFVTAYDQYAIRGYKYDPIDYLMKPVDHHSLQSVVKRMQQLKHTSLPINVQEKFQELFAKVIGEPKISISDNKKMRLVKTAEILYCESCGNYTTFFLADDTELTSSKSLKFNESKLNVFNFIRIHRSYLINLIHIDYIDKEFGGAVVMSNGKSLPVSQNYKKILFDKLDKI